MSPCTDNTPLLDAVLCRALLEATWEGVFLTDADGIVKMMNPGAERLFGYRAREVIGQSISLLIPEPHVSQSEQGWKSHAQTREAKIFRHRREVEGLRKNGRRFPMQLSLVEFSAGGEQAFVNIAHDLTWERQLNDQLHQVVAVFEHAVVGLMITDPNGKIEAVNPAFTDLTGYTRDEMLGQHSRLLKSGRHDASYYAAIWQSIHDGGAWRGEIWNRGKNGSIHAAWLSISALTDSYNEPRHFLAVYADITPLKNMEQRFAYLAHHDPLTGLANRLLFNARVEQAIRRQPRRGGSLALLFLDLDRFKHVNDTFGHATGDTFLTEVAKRLAAVIRQEDTVARLGGDEFALLLEQLAGPRDAAFVARKVLTVLSSPFRVGKQELHIGASIGISLFPMDGQSVEELLQSADGAMYRAKQQAGNRLRSFEFASDLDTAERNLELWKTSGSAPAASPRKSVTRAPLGASVMQEKSKVKGTRVARVHERVLALVDALLTASSACSVKELAETLPELFDLLLMHFADEERRGGFFDAVRAKRNDREDELETLASQHFQIMRELAALVKLSHASWEDGETVDEPFRLFLGAEQLAHNIKNHEHKEESLFPVSSYVN